MLVYDPAKRITVESLMNDYYFKELKDLENNKVNRILNSSNEGSQLSSNSKRFQATNNTFIITFTNNKSQNQKININLKDKLSLKKISNTKKNYKIKNNKLPVKQKLQKIVKKNFENIAIMKF